MKLYVLQTACRRWSLMPLMTVCLSFAFANPVIAESPALRKAVENFSDAKTLAREKLHNSFETVLKKLAQQRRLSAQERSHLIDAVRAEQQRFDQTGLYPWSEPMREEFLQYFKAVAKAEMELSREFQREIDKALKAGDELQASEYRKELETLTMVKPVAQWLHSAVGWPDVTITMYSNGKFTDRDGSVRCLWTYKDGTFVMDWPAGGGGIVTGIVRLSPDGLTYTGADKNGVLNTGKYLAP